MFWYFWFMYPYWEHVEQDGDRQAAPPLKKKNPTQVSSSWDACVCVVCVSVCVEGVGWIKSALRFIFNCSTSVQMCGVWISTARHERSSSPASECLIVPLTSLWRASHSSAGGLMMSAGFLTAKGTVAIDWQKAHLLQLSLAECNWSVLCFSDS